MQSWAYSYDAIFVSEDEETRNTNERSKKRRLRFCCSFMAFLHYTMGWNMKTNIGLNQGRQCFPVDCRSSFFAGSGQAVGRQWAGRQKNNSKEGRKGNASAVLLCQKYVKLQQLFSQNSEFRSTSMRRVSTTWYNSTYSYTREGDFVTKRAHNHSGHHPPRA